MTIERWEFRAREASYLSLPALGAPRYRVRRQGRKWLAYKIRLMPGGTPNIHVCIGSFDTPRAAMSACREHEREKHETA